MVYKCLCCCESSNKNRFVLSVLNYDGTCDSRPNFRARNVMAHVSEEEETVVFESFENFCGTLVAFIPPVVCHIGDVMRLDEDGLSRELPFEERLDAILKESRVPGIRSEANVFDSNPFFYLSFKTHAKGRTSLRVTFETECGSFLRSIPAGTELRWHVENKSWITRRFSCASWSWGDSMIFVK